MSSKSPLEKWTNPPSHYATAVRNQSGGRLKILVTDNGELVSNKISEWCAINGIDHQLTVYVEGLNVYIEQS